VLCGVYVVWFENKKPPICYHNNLHTNTKHINAGLVNQLDFLLSKVWSPRMSVSDHDSNAGRRLGPRAVRLRHDVVQQPLQIDMYIVSQVRKYVHVCMLNLHCFTVTYNMMCSHLW